VKHYAFNVVHALTQPVVYQKQKRHLDRESLGNTDRLLKMPFAEPSRKMECSNY